MDNWSALPGGMLLGRLCAYYVGGLFLFEFWSLVYTGDFNLGISTLHFDPPLAAVSVFIVLIGLGLMALRTHPATRDQLLAGAFNPTEVIAIESLTILGVTALYASIEPGGYLDVAGMELYSTLLGGALSAMFEIAIMFYILRWVYVVSQSAGNTTQRTDES